MAFMCPACRRFSERQQCANCQRLGLPLSAGMSGFFSSVSHAVKKVASKASDTVKKVVKGSTKTAKSLLDVAKDVVTSKPVAIATAPAGGWLLNEDIRGKVVDAVKKTAEVGLKLGPSLLAGGSMGAAMFGAMTGMGVPEQAAASMTNDLAGEVGSPEEAASLGRVAGQSWLSANKSWVVPTAIGGGALVLSAVVLALVLREKKPPKTPSKTASEAWK